MALHEWMKEILNRIGLLYAVSLSFAIITFLISIFLNIFLYFRSKRQKKPTYTVRNFELLTEGIKALDDLTVSWHGRLLRNLTLSRITIWNRGNEPIKRTDVAPADPFRIGVDSELEIIACKVNKYSERANNFQAHKENNSVLIEFDYMSRNEGAVIDVYHTGTVGEYIFISGTVIGAGPLQQGEYDNEHYWNSFIGPVTKHIAFLDNFLKRNNNRFIKLIGYSIVRLSFCV